MRPITIILVILLLFCCMSHGNTAKAQTESDGGTGVTVWKCYSGDSVVALTGIHVSGLGEVKFGTIRRVAQFRLQGLRLTWRWEANDLETARAVVAEVVASYQFVIRPNGEGLYYDFSGAEEGEKRLPQDTFRCKKII